MDHTNNQLLQQQQLRNVSQQVSQQNIRQQSLGQSGISQHIQPPSSSHQQYATSKDETNLTSHKQQDITQQQQNQSTALRQNTQTYQQTHSSVPSFQHEEEEESHSLFGKGFEGFPIGQGISIEPQQMALTGSGDQLTPPHPRHQGFEWQSPPMGFQGMTPQQYQNYIMMQQMQPNEMIAQAMHYPFESIIKDTRLVEHGVQDPSLIMGVQHHMPVRTPSQKLSASKLQREWQSEGKQVIIHGMSSETYVKLIRPALCNLKLNILKENFNKDDIIIKLETKNEAMITVNTINNILQQSQHPDSYKIMVSRQLESIQERDDSDNNGSSHSGDKNEGSDNILKDLNLAHEQRLYLDQELYEEEEHGEPQVEYFKEEDPQQHQQLFFQPSPFYVAKTQGMMAQSLVEKTPVGFNVEGDYMKNPRAFTPLDQITTGISDEDTIHYNLSGNPHSYSFNQSNEAFQAFQYRQHTHQSSEDSGSVHSAHANVPQSFNVQFRQSHDVQQSPFQSVLIPSQNQTLLQVDPATGQATGIIINQLPPQPIIISPNDPAYQQITRNIQFQQQHSWPYQQNIMPHQVPVQQQFYHTQMIPTQQQRMDFQKLQEQQMQQHSRMMAQEFKQHSNSQEAQNPSRSFTPDLQNPSTLSKQFSQMHIRDDKNEISLSQSSSQQEEKKSLKSETQEFKPSSSFASSTTEEKLNNEVDIWRILNGEEQRTTIMVRNIPNKFKQMTLLEMINQRHQGKYDYFYLPMDLKTQCNVGYAFINFTHPIYILDFFLEFQSIEWQNATQDCKSGKISKLAFANFQGKDELIQHHNDKNIMKKTEEQIKPLVLDSKQVPEEEIQKIKQRYYQQKRSGELDKKLGRLYKKQKRASVHNGPHPHYQSQETSQYQGHSQTAQQHHGHQAIRQVTQQSQQHSRQQALQHQNTYYGSAAPRAHQSQGYQASSGSQGQQRSSTGQSYTGSQGYQKRTSYQTYQGGSRQQYYQGSSGQPSRQQQHSSFYQGSGSQQQHHASGGSSSSGHYNQSQQTQYHHNQ
eukprot:403342907